MVLPLALIAHIATGLVQGPLTKVLEAHVADAALRRKLAAELETQFVAHLGKTAELGANVVMSEVQSEHWLTRSWRPMLMLLLMGFLIIAGILLPLADLWAGHHIAFEPRWQMLPAGFWDFLSVGMGGYIGGRSLEKVMGLAFPGDAAARPASRGSARR